MVAAFAAAGGERTFHERLLLRQRLRGLPLLHGFLRGRARVNITAWCKKDDARLEGDLPGPLRCPDCQTEYPLRASEKLAQGELDVCALCGYSHFHLKKDFPRQIGMAIVLIAAALCFTNIFPPGFFYMPLIIASVIDLLLYLVLPWKVVCYVCEAEYKGAKVGPELRAYDLETATECKRLKWPKAAV